MNRKNSNHQGLIIKIIFFLAYASSAAWMTYFYVFLKEDPGLSGFEIGIIAGFQQFNNIFVLPVWGIWADRYGRKRMLLFSLGGVVLLLPGFLFLQGVAVISLLVILLTLFYNPLMPLVDTISLDYEEQTKGKATYGEIRMWGSIGWGVSSFLTGLWINSSELSLIFPLSTMLFFLTFLLILGSYKPLKSHKNISKLKRGVIWELLAEKRVLLSFLSILFVYSVFSAPLYLLINVYYNEIGASTSILGLAFMVQGASELPFFFFGKKIVRKFGAWNVFMFTLFVSALRMLAYGINNSPMIAVGLGLLNGVSIGLFFVSVTAFVHSLVPKNLRSTGQSLIYTFYAVGVALGNIFSGVLYDILSMKVAMIINGLVIILLFIGILIFGVDNLKQNQQESLLSADHKISQKTDKN